MRIAATYHETAMTDFLFLFRWLLRCRNAAASTQSEQGGSRGKSESEGGKTKAFREKAYIGGILSSISIIKVLFVL
jgi:hypothetical protein